MLDANIQPKGELGLAYELKLTEEFNTKLDPRLRAVLLECGRWVRQEFDKRLVYTCVIRTQEENKKVGGAKYSAHLYGRAVDIRTHNLTGSELSKLLTYIEVHWLKDEQWLYLLVHGQGNNKHFHINIKFSATHGSFA